ncbi:MAG: mechanosensitive ion channel, partial [Lachnospiraceae bacterium]|nr:mechanosensitive ion channel [Lachnospiraceae bacterium]
MMNSNEILTYIEESIHGKHGFLPYALIFGVVVVLMTCVIMSFVRRIFKRMRQNSKAIHLLFFERLVQVLIVIAAIFVFIFGYIGTATLWNTLFGSTVVIGGIVGIAGQDVIRDILGGLMLSVYKPFDVGDRIYLSDIPKSVVVEDVTMRHVVLRARDGMHYIVPNSEINKRTI